MAASDLSIRLSLADANAVLQALRQVGDKGQAALALVEAASDKATVSGQRLERQLKALKESLDPTARAQADLARNQDLLNEAFRRGRLSTEELSNYSRLLAERHREVAGTMRTTGTAAADAAAAATGAINLQAYQVTNLGYQIQDMVVQLAGGQNPFLILVQQVPQAVDAVGGFGAALRLLVTPTSLAVAGLAAISAPMALGAWHAAAMAKEVRTLSIALQSVGRAGEVGAADLQGIAHAAARSGPFGRSDTLAAVGELSAFPRISADLVPELTGVAKDLAAATGQELPDAARKLAEALDSGYAGIKKLDDAYRFLSPDQLATIRHLEEQGRVMEATGMAADALRDHLSGLAEKSMGPLDKLLHSAAQGWNAVNDALAKDWRTPSIDSQLERLRGMAHPQGLLQRILFGEDGADRLDGAQAAKIAELERASAALAAPDRRRATQDLSADEIRSIKAYEDNREVFEDKRAIARLSPAERPAAQARAQARNANTLTGGWSDLNVGLAGKEADLAVTTAARDATDQAERQAAAQERLAQVAGQGAAAQMEVARANAVAEFSFRNLGKDADRYADALVRTDAAKLAGQRTEWVAALDREAAANATLADGYRSGDPALIRRAEVTKLAEERSRALGISIDDTTARILRQNATAEDAAIARQVGDLDRQTAAQERLAAVAGRGALAQMDVARANAVAKFSFQHAGKGAATYAAGLVRLDAAKVLAQRTEWIATLDRETAANTELADAYRSGDVEAVRRSQLAREATEAHRRFGISIAEATTRLAEQHAAMAAPEIARHLADMKTEADLRERLFRAQSAHDPAAAREATIAGRIDQFRRANPYASGDDLAEARQAYVRESLTAQRQGALSAHLGLDPTAHHTAAQAELDDLAQVTDAEGNLILSREDAARRQSQIDQDYRRAQIDNLMATRTFAGGAEAALRDYVDNAGNHAKQASEVVGNALKGFEDGLVGIATGTKTAKEAFSDMATSIMNDLLRMSIRQSITGPLAAMLGLGGGNDAGGDGGGSGVGMLGNLLGNNSGSGWATDLFGSFGLFHDGGVVGGPTASAVTAPYSLFSAAPRYHAGGVVGLGPDEVPIIAKKGERVLTEAQQAASARPAERPVTVVMNITTPDAGSFRASQGQIAAEMARAVTRGRRNL